MSESGFRVARLESIPAVRDHGLPIDAAWKPIRHHLDVDVFGMNAYVATSPGDVVIEEHDEDSHRELYFVHVGEAEFTVQGESLHAPAGTFVYVHDPATSRKAVAEQPGTTVIAIGAAPGVVFAPSEWELRRTARISRP